MLMYSYFMKLFKTMILIVCFTSCFNCSSDDSLPAETIKENTEEVKSSSAELISIQIKYQQSIFNCTINGNKIEMTRPLPASATEISIQSISISSKASSNKTIGNLLTVSEEGQNITITAEDGITNKTFNLHFKLNNYSTIVNKHGLLKVNGNMIVDKNNESVSLAGNSFFWSNNNWGGSKYYKPSVVSWLSLDWNTTIVRAAMGVEDPGGYIEDQVTNKNRIKTIVDAAIEQGLYVIIDWHSHHAEDYPNEAIAFFKEMATLYGEYDNVIYEIYNEPLDVSWDQVIKPYAENIIKEIRLIDPDNLIIVGTPEWSQGVDHAANNPISDYDNIAYTLHFYSIHHKQWLRDKANTALNKGIALFVTEWGVLGYTQNDPETEAWMKWCKDHNISHCSWAINDKEEAWSIVKPNSSALGSWNDSNLTEAGKLTRSINRTWQE